ncbi:hypothetical protein GGE68_001412 [Rhizobium leguminosarum]|uniref:hypothetical protein n=1 Tax=Rhizobium leguminosarum TaxID=384 RepID=UPI00160DC3EC|nr:hypothetical protein [Rhizobium leguminosarum]MBB5663236.1 hypothetical protein [Rhizobium leguminosarum]
MTELQEAFKWLFGRDTGMSSKAILGHMLAGVSDGSYPYDPADLGRCLRLLEKFPQWKHRMGEMAQYGGAWPTYAKHWADLETSMADEVGIDWSKGNDASLTYKYMKALRAQAEAA